MKKMIAIAICIIALMAMATVAGVMGLVFASPSSAAQYGYGCTGDVLSNAQVTPQAKAVGDNTVIRIQVQSLSCVTAVRMVASPQFSYGLDSAMFQGWPPTNWWAPAFLVKNDNPPGKYVIKLTPYSGPSPRYPSGNPVDVMFIIDGTAPTVSNVQPSGTVTMADTTINADYSDPDPASGIDSASVNVYLDGNPVTGCSATETHVDCPVTGLTNGTYVITGSVADKVGNASQISGSFTVAICTSSKPKLGLWLNSVKWASYADYSAHVLTAQFSLKNLGASSAYNMSIKNIICTNGVIATTPMPILLGNVTAGSSVGFTTKYSVPFGVSNTRISVTASSADVCGTTYTYP